MHGHAHNTTKHPINAGSTRHTGYAYEMIALAVSASSGVGGGLVLLVDEDEEDDVVLRSRRGTGGAGSSLRETARLRERLLNFRESFLRSVGRSVVVVAVGFVDADMVMVCRSR